MKWTDHLTDAERLELDRLETIRETAKDAFNATRLKLKSRCESRMRQIARKATDD